MGHGFKPSSSRGASSVGGSAVGGVVKQQQQTVLQAVEQLNQEIGEIHGRVSRRPPTGAC
jgi:hypothetical protein